MKNFGAAMGLVAFFAVGSANATVLYNTDISTTTLGDNVGSSGSGRGGSPLGDEIMVPAGQTWNITDVKADLYDQTASSAGSVLVYLVPNCSGAPCTSSGSTLSGAGGSGLPILLGQVANSGLGTSNTPASLTLITTSNGTISGGASGTDYWLEFVGSGDNFNCGLVSSANCVATTSPAKLLYSSATSSGGTTGTLGLSSSALINPNTTLTEWANSATHLEPGNSTAVTDFAITVDGTVPEPASLAILGAGLAGLGLIRRRRAKTNV